MKSDKLFPMTSEDFDKIMTNPFYCLSQIHEVFVQKHEPLITEEEFVKAGLIMIEEIGAQRYIELLLENLKGNYVATDQTELPTPDKNTLYVDENQSLSLEDDTRVREYIASLSDDPEWKKRARTYSGQELVNWFETHGFMNENKDKQD